MISANGGLPAHRYTRQVTPRWPRGSEPASAVAAPLTAMFNADFQLERTAVHQVSFDKLKQAMINATHLSAIDPRQPYHLYTDASKDCVGATLAQRCAHGKYKGHLRLIAFMSQKMQPAEARYPIREQALLAIVLALKSASTYFKDRSRCTCTLTTKVFDI